MKVGRKLKFYALLDGWGADILLTDIHSIPVDIHNKICKKY